MRGRSAIISLVCAAALVVSGCSSGIAGIPQLPGTGGSASDDASGSSAEGLPGDLSTGQPSSPSGDAGSGNSDLPSLPTELLPSDLGSLPTDLGSLPGNLGSLPGMDSSCLTVAGLLMSVGVMFLKPTMGGQPLTEQDVKQAFDSLGEVPPEIQQPVQVLHDAALQAVGKPADQATQILDSDRVSQAMDALSNYTETQCGSN